jgi:hypothetical protein
MPTSPTANRSPIQFFVVGPDDLVYENRDNLSTETISKFKRFESFKDRSWTPLRFAFDPNKNAIYIQDPIWFSLLESKDEYAGNIVNRALEFIYEKFPDAEGSAHWTSGEPPDTAIQHSLSQYGLAWQDISKYVASEFQAGAPDLPVVEYTLGQNEQPPAQQVTFNPNGATKGDVSVSGPCFLVLKNERMDYGIINTLLTRLYLTNLPIIVKNVDKSQHMGLVTNYFLDNVNRGGYERYFAFWTRNGTAIRRVHPMQSFADPSEKWSPQNRLTNESEIRNYRDLAGYSGPIVMFAYLPVKNQVIFQNYHPEDMAHYELLSKMKEDIVSVVSSVKKVPPEKLTLSHDDSEVSPYITMISNVAPVWTMIKDILAPQAGIEPHDIQVVFMPISQNGSTVAAFVQNAQEEDVKTPESKNFRVSHGISVDYPFIAVDPRNPLGTQQYALIHEYKHFEQKLANVLPKKPYSFEGSVDDARDADEKERRFIEYINTPSERGAHIQQMVFMLYMNMSEKAVLDAFAPNTMPLARAQYRKLFDEAKRIFDQQIAEKRHFRRQQPQPPQQPTQRTAAISYPGGNDFWFIGSLEDQMEGLHQNNIPSDEAPVNETGTYNLRRQKQRKALVPKTMEEMLSDKHDPELGYMKTTEQLLRESQI